MQNNDLKSLLKVHKTYFIGHHNMVNFHISPAREHDSQHCRLTEDLQGCGLLVELGYVSHQFLLDCQRLDIDYVVKVKTGWKVNVDSVIEGEAAADAFDKGPFDYAAALAGKKLRFKNGRLELDGRKPESVRAMLYASLLGSVIINRIVHHDHQELFSSWKQRPRGPMHVRLVALALAACHTSLAQALTEPDRHGDAWQRAIAVIEGSGRDPNWRNRPSVLDEMLGFTAPPGRPRRKKAAMPRN